MGGVQELVAPGVIATHDADWNRQGAQPINQEFLLLPSALLLLSYGIGFRFLRAENVTLAPGCFHVFDEGGAAFIRVAGTIVTAEGKTMETAGREMFGRQTSDLAIVCFYGGNIGGRQDSPDIHRWNIFLQDGIGNRPVFDAGDDAVTLPVLEPFGENFAQSPFLVIDEPLSSRAHFIRNPVEHSATK